ncbi:MAG: M20/M25/M40 family metallo-hydrolase [Planctomycetota bacterium]|nr:M20/M25/M40 family metallo-hydrolase [Planctomycetota bacterium]
MPSISPELLARLKSLVSRDRLVRDTVDLCAVYSRTGEAGPALDRLAEILTRDGFEVERPAAGHPQAPAVAVRLKSGKPGPTLQFNGHLDTVHLPFVPPQVSGDRITGTGSCDMKGGTAAAVEALRVLRESGAFTQGSILFTGHDLHEAPWGDGRQLEQLIRLGYCGDAVLIPEYLNGCIPVVGRGLATWKATIRRSGPPVHEVMRPKDQPSVIDAGAELIARLRQYATFLAGKNDPVAGSETVFVGQVHSGEIFNQYPQELWMEGTRRWLPSESRHIVEQEFRGLVKQVADRTKTAIVVEWFPVRDGFQLEPDHAFVRAFQDNYTATTGKSLEFGAKPFCDDCNTFWSLADIPGITHGPNAGGAHTLEEWVSIDDLCRVAHLYAATAIGYCVA